MGHYETDYWVSETWGMNRRESRSGAYSYYCPDSIAGRDVRLTPQAAAAVSRAESAICQLNATSGPLTDTEPLARLILRAEALASSRIEGLELTAGKLMEYEALDELNVPHRTDGTEAAVIDNIAAMREAIDGIAGLPHITVDDICRINDRLLSRTDMSDYAGMLRGEQNWIGGNRMNPLGAAYVPPTPALVPSLMEDLAEFCNSSELPCLAVAAVAHAQLETIHPFADGNGRTGRTLVHVILRHGGIAPRVVPPVSLVLATDKERYINNLTAFRTIDGEEPSIDDAMSDWIEYFANACLVACVRAGEFEDRVVQIKEGWRQRLRPRANSAMALLIDELPGKPVVSVESAARMIGRSREAARLAIKAMAAAKVLHQSSKNKKSDIYAAREILDAFTSYERALATPGGDTSVEGPSRRVPQRVPRERR